MPSKKPNNIATWNMQGSSSESVSKLRSLVQINDVVCVQESGALPGLFADSSNTNDTLFKVGKKQVTYKQLNIKDRKKSGGYKKVHAFHFPWSKSGGNCRCSMATFISDDAIDIGSNIKKSVNLNLIDLDQGKDLRPALVIGNKDFSIANVHMPSTSNSYPAKLTAKLILEKMQKKKKYVITGDFNCEPKQIKDKIKKQVGAMKKKPDISNLSHTKSTGVATQLSGRQLDHAIGNNVNITQRSNVGISGSSDHGAQTFELKWNN